MTVADAFLVCYGIIGVGLWVCVMFPELIDRIWRWLEEDGT